MTIANKDKLTYVVLYNKNYLLVKFIFWEITMQEKQKPSKFNAELDDEFKVFFYESLQHVKNVCDHYRGPDTDHSSRERAVTNRTFYAIKHFVETIQDIFTDPYYEEFMLRKRTKSLLRQELLSQPKYLAEQLIIDLSIPFSLYEREIDDGTFLFERLSDSIMEGNHKPLFLGVVEDKTHNTKRVLTDCQLNSDRLGIVTYEAMKKRGELND